MGSGTREGPLDAAVAPGERADREVLWLEEGGGGGPLLAGGCLAVAVLLCLKGGRGRICSKLQEADEVLIC